MDIAEAYSAIQRKVSPKIRKRYQPLLDDLVDKYSHETLEHQHSKIIWVCWLQGIENAPEIVKVCSASLSRYICDREIIYITEKNIDSYVQFPEHIQKKYKEGKIPMAQFSDLLRLVLLTRYGGTWVDATVLCTGLNEKEKLLDSDLFLFQYLQKGEKRFLGISNWFITASSNQKVLLILRDMLYQYWKDYDCVVAYFIFHIFFGMIAERMSEEFGKMSRMSNKYCFYLEHRLGDEYDETWMKELTARCSFHKLNGRLWNEAEGKDNSFLSKIKEMYDNCTLS